MQAPPNLTTFLSSNNGPSEFALALHLVLTLQPLFAQLNILTLKDINNLLTGIVIYKSVNGVLPRTSSSFYLFTSVHNIHKHHTRSHNNLFLPFTRTSYSIHTLRHYVPRLWNSIDLSITTKSSVSQFKASYTNLLIPQYMTMDMT